MSKFRQIHQPTLNLRCNKVQGNEHIGIVLHNPNEVTIFVDQRIECGTTGEINALRQCVTNKDTAVNLNLVTLTGIEVSNRGKTGAVGVEVEGTRLIS